MLEVDPDETLAEIRDMIRKYEDEVPELKEVKLSANKDELIDQLNQALEEYTERVTALEEQPDLYSDIAAEGVLFDAAATAAGEPLTSPPSVATDVEDGEPSPDVDTEEIEDDSPSTSPYDRGPSFEDVMP